VSRESYNGSSKKNQKTRDNGDEDEESSLTTPKNEAKNVID
jgi:hypothetical protein